MTAETLRSRRLLVGALVGAAVLAVAAFLVGHVQRPPAVGAANVRRVGRSV